jgi:hypothetical protein
VTLVSATYRRSDRNGRLGILSPGAEVYMLDSSPKGRPP